MRGNSGPSERKTVTNDPHYQTVRRLLDDLLQDSSDEFRSRVIDIVYTYGIDPNDPNLVVLVGSGILERLLKTAPEEFETLFLMFFEKLQQSFSEIRQWSRQEQASLQAVMQELGTTADSLVAELSAQVDELKAFADEQRAVLIQRVEAMLTLSQEQHDLMQQRIEEEANLAISHHHQAIQEQSLKYIKTTAAALKQKHRWEASAYLLGMMAVVLSMGFASGFILATWRAQQANWYAFWRWNQDHYTACVDAGKTTCNFHIVPPEEW